MAFGLTLREHQYAEAPPRPFSNAAADALLVTSFACAVEIAEGLIKAGQEDLIEATLEGYREALVTSGIEEIAPFYDVMSYERVIAAAREKVAA